MSKQGLEWLRLSTVGIHLIVATGVGFAIGRFVLDPLFGTERAFTLIFSLFGIAAGFLNLYRELEILNRTEAEANQEQSGPQTERAAETAADQPSRQDPGEHG